MWRGRGMICPVYVLGGPERQRRTHQPRGWSQPEEQDVLHADAPRGPDEGVQTLITTSQWSDILQTLFIIYKWY